MDAPAAAHLVLEEVHRRTILLSLDRIDFGDRPHTIRVGTKRHLNRGNTDPADLRNPIHECYFCISPRQRTKLMQKPTDDDNSPFIADTVQSTGHSPATIRRGLQIGENIIPELYESLSTSPLAKREADLLYLSFMTRTEQLDVVRLLREASKTPETLSAIIGASSRETQLPTLPELKQRIWSGTSETERQEFLTWLAREGSW